MPNSYADWRARLAEANDPQFWPIEEIDRLLKEGLAQLWCDDAGALVTRVVYYPGGAIAVEALAGAGAIDALIAMTPKVNTWAREIGATHLLVLGRPGWVRALPGWRHHQSILIKEVVDG